MHPCPRHHHPPGDPPVHARIVGCFVGFGLLTLSWLGAAAAGSTDDRGVGACGVAGHRSWRVLLRRTAGLSCGLGCTPRPACPRHAQVSSGPADRLADGGAGGRDASEGKGPHRRPQQRLDRRLEEVAKAVGGGYSRLQMPLRLALAGGGDCGRGGGGGVETNCEKLRENCGKIAGKLRENCDIVSNPP